MGLRPGNGRQSLREMKMDWTEELLSLTDVELKSSEEVDHLLASLKFLVQQSLQFKYRFV